MTLDTVKGARQAEWVGTGATTSTPIPIGNMRSGDIVLAVVKHTGTGQATGLNPASFTAANGSVSSSSVDTSGFQLTIVFVPTA